MAFLRFWYIVPAVDEQPLGPQRKQIPFPQVDELDIVVAPLSSQPSFVKALELKPFFCFTGLVFSSLALPLYELHLSLFIACRFRFRFRFSSSSNLIRYRRRIPARQQRFVTLSVEPYKPPGD